MFTQNCKFFIFLFFVCSESNSKIAYFGYYFGMDALNSLAGTVNIMMISNQWKSSDIEKLIELDRKDMQALQNVGAKGILDVSGVFFNVFDNYSLFPDWESRFNTYWRGIWDQLQNLIAFSPVDEPDMNIHGSFDYIYNMICHIININIDTTIFKDKIKIITTLTASGVIKIKNGELKIPNEVQWLGFDEYNCWGNECHGAFSIQEKLQILNNYMGERGGNTFVVPQLFTNLTNPDVQSQNFIVKRLEEYKALCESFFSCNAMIGFIYSSVGHAQLYGLDRMPLVLEYIKKNKII